MIFLYQFIDFNINLISTPKNKSYSPHKHWAVGFSVITQTRPEQIIMDD